MFQSSLAAGIKAKNKGFPPEFRKLWFAEACIFKSGNPLVRKYLKDETSCISYKRL